MIFPSKQSGKELTRSKFQRVIMSKEIWREKHSQNKEMFNETDSKKE